MYRNGSKRAVNIGGAYTATGEFHFYRMKHQLKEHVLENVKALHERYPKMFFLLDKATWHNNALVRGYLEEKDIPYMFFPTAAPDLNPTEECWRQTRENVTANKSHNSEEGLLDSLAAYWDRQPFAHNVLNYLSP